jgi:membrane protein
MQLRRFKAMSFPNAMKKLLRGLIEICAFVRETFESFLEDHALRMAASLAFYTTFSITPALLIGLSVAGVVIGNSRAESELAAGVGRLINPEAAEYVFSLVARFSEELRGRHLPLIGILGAVVAATAVFVDLQSALNVIWRVSLRDRQGLLSIIRSRAISFVFVVGIGILLMISVVTSAVLATINGLFMKALPIPEELLRWIQILAQFGMVPLLLATTYKLVPDADIEWKDVLPGAIITAVLFLLGKSVFGMYLSLGILGSVYGAAGSLFILLAWVYYSAQVFFLGAEMTKVYAMRYGSRSEARRQNGRHSSQQ